MKNAADYQHMAALQQPHALLVVTDTTPGIEFGIDAHSWELGPKFEGLHSLPAGLHLLTFAPGNIAGREGVWIHCAGGVHRQTWDARNECLGAAPALADAQLRSLAAAARCGALTLAPYPPGHAQIWAAVARHVDEPTLRRCNLRLDAVFGPGGIDGDAPVANEPRWTPVGPAAMRQRRAGDATAFFGPDATLRLKATAAPDVLLKELALAFVIFLALGSLSALTQWQYLVRLFCACDALMAEDAALFDALASLLTAQLALAPEDFFRDALGKDEDVLRAALLEFFANASDKPRLANAANGLLAFAQRRFGLWADHASAAALVAARVHETGDNIAQEVDIMRHVRPGEDPTMCATRLIEAGGEGYGEAVAYLEALGV